MSPYDITLRELLWMARGAWDKTAMICAVLANCNRTAKSRSFASADFHPYRERRGRGGMSLTPKTIHMLKPRFKKKDTDGPPTATDG